MKFLDLSKKSVVSFTVVTIFVLGLASQLLVVGVMAETLTSPNYKIDGATISGGNDFSNSGTGNYSIYATISEFSGNPRSTSTSYELREGDPDVFQASTPAVACFETTSSGSSNCTTGPSYLNTYGMVRVCGPTGCYGRARFEIDEQGNPSDTLYGIQISTDDFASDIQAIDATTYAPKDFDTRSLSDYQSKTDWETDTFNLKRLQPNTQYYLRVVALHGDFTESTPSPSSTATTAYATVDFDIDITDEAESTPETGSPYTISFTGSTELYAGGAAITASDLIWLDLETNATGGAAIIQRGQYGGLYSSNQSYTITSSTEDLDIPGEGFGIQNFDWSGTETYQEDYSGSGGSNLGAISVETDYNGSVNNVGQIDTSHIRVYGSNGPIDTGRTALYVKGRASESTPSDTDYVENILFVATGRYGGE